MSASPATCCHPKDAVAWAGTSVLKDQPSSSRDFASAAPAAVAKKKPHGDPWITWGLVNSACTRAGGCRAQGSCQAAIASHSPTSSLAAAAG